MSYMYISLLSRVFNFTADAAFLQQKSYGRIWDLHYQLHHQFLIDPKFDCSSNQWSHPGDPLSSPMPSSPLIRDRVELDQLIIMLLH